VIEAISDRTWCLDEGRKLHAYECFRVREYWLYYPKSKTVGVWERSAESLGLKAQLSAPAHDVLTTPLLALSRSRWRRSSRVIFPPLLY
jgi:Uma2 family endonuclease